MKKNINQLIPPFIQTLMNIFREEGHQLYLVGGCVRDWLMEQECHDYDMTTNATPEQMLSLAKKHHFNAVPTGKKHGTITFIMAQHAIEITTFREEKEYEKHRFPKNVTFTHSLQEDVKRRDFTINAIAMDENGIYDYHDGCSDLKKGLVRCVNDPQLRFEEDALRILRALRFSFQLNFVIEDSTWQAIQEKAHLLRYISSERIRDELCKILMSDHDDLLVILRASRVLDVIFPEFIPTYECEQETPWHIHNVFYHMNAVMNASKGYSLPMKLALLFHDIEKPSHKTYDERGNAHFLGHAEAGAETAKIIMKRLKFDHSTIQQVTKMIYYHDYYMYDNRKSVHKLMYYLNGDFTIAFQILKIQLADNMGKNQKKCMEKNRMIYAVTIMLKQMQKDKECFTIKDLAINGNDMLSLGYQGKEIKEGFEHLLRFILNQQEKNNKEQLCKEAQRYLERKRSNENFNRQ